MEIYSSLIIASPEIHGNKSVNTLFSVTPTRTNHMKQNNAKYIFNRPLKNKILSRKQ